MLRPGLLIAAVLAGFGLILDTLVGVTRRFTGSIALGGRALATNPRLLLLDEPTEGLAPIIVQELPAALTRLLREEKLPAIIVEQHAQKILPITDRALILERGRIVHQSDSAALLADPPPLERFLGVTGR